MAIEMQLFGAPPGAYLNTVKYLRGSPTAVRIIDKLEGMAEKMLVRVSNVATDKVGSMWDLDYSYSGGVIRWWIYDWTKIALDVDALGYQTPGIALIHEMGHAYQYFFLADMRKEMDAKKKAIFPFSRNRHNEKIENHNVMHHESKVAQQLDEPTRRNYADNIEMNLKECLRKGLPDYMR